MLAVADQLDEPIEVDAARLGDLRLGGPSPAHRHDDRGAAPRRAASRATSPLMAVLPGAFARADHGDRGDRDGGPSSGRREPEVRRPRSGTPRVSATRRKLHALAVAENRLVRQVEHDLGAAIASIASASAGHAVGSRRHARNAEVGQRTRVDLLDAADEDSADHLVAAFGRGRDAPIGSPVGSARRRRAPRFASVDSLLGAMPRVGSVSRGGRYSPTGTVRCWMGASCSRWS